MSAIVTGILSALLSLIISLIASVLELFSDSFIDGFGMNFSAVIAFFPMLLNIIEFIKTLAAWWLVFTIFLFILKTFGLAMGLKVERNRIWTYFLRFVILGSLSLNATQIVSFIFTGLDSAFQNIVAIDASSIGSQTFGDTLLEMGNDVLGGIAIAAGGALTGGVGLIKVLVMVVIAIMLIIDFFKLLLEFVEKYIKLIFYIVLAPLAFVMGILEETKEIFNYYWRVYVADLFVYLMTSLLIKGFINIMSNSSAIPDTFSAVDAFLLSDLAWAFFALAYTKIAVRFDQFIASLGVTVSKGAGSSSSLTGVLGASAMLLRGAMGSGGGAGTKTGGGIGNAIQRSFGELANNVSQGARQGFAKGTGFADSMGKALVGAGKGAFVDSTNVGKMANMARNGDLTAAALNSKFANAKDIAKNASALGVSNEEYKALSERSAETGFTPEQQKRYEDINAMAKDGTLNSADARKLQKQEGLIPPILDGSPNDDSNNVIEIGAHAGIPPDSVNKEVAAAVADSGPSMAEKYASKDNPNDDSNYKATPDSVAYSPHDKAKDTLVNPNVSSEHQNSKFDVATGRRDFNDESSINNKGEVSLPNNAYIATSSGGIGKDGNRVDGGSVVHSDGTVTKANQITRPDGSTSTVTNDTTLDDRTLADGSVVNPDGTLSIGGGHESPGGMTLSTTGETLFHSDGSKTDTGGSGLTQHADGSVSHADGAVTYRNGKSLHSDGSLTHANGMTVMPDGTRTFADGSVLHADGSLTKGGITNHSDGTTTHGDGRVTHSDGSVTYGVGYTDESSGISYDSGWVQHSDGSISNGNGGINIDGSKDENGNLIFESISESYGGSYTHTNGTVSHADGTVKHADGSISNENGNGTVSHYISNEDGSTVHTAISQEKGSIDFFNGGDGNVVSSIYDGSTVTFNDSASFNGSTLTYSDSDGNTTATVKTVVNNVKTDEGKPTVSYTTSINRYEHGSDYVRDTTELYGGYKSEKGKDSEYGFRNATVNSGVLKFALNSKFKNPRSKR